MEQKNTILGNIDPEIGESLLSRRDALRKGATASSVVTAGLAMASVPVALAALSRDVFGQSSPAAVQAVIDFALKLEIFENEFYKAVLGISGSATQNLAFAPVRATAPAGIVAALQQIQRHEEEHVAFLLANGAVNTLGLTAASFDFTGARGVGNGPFLPATTNLDFLLLTAQGAEDTGVRAYKGQATNLMGNGTVLEAALRIHSVEARHASKIRRLRRGRGATGVKFSGTVTGTGISAAGAANIANPPAGAVTGLTAIYASEDNTMQGGVNISTLPNLPTGIDRTAALTEAFDEPLTLAQVVAIVQPFFIPSLA